MSPGAERAGGPAAERSAYVRRFSTIYQARYPRLLVLGLGEVDPRDAWQLSRSRWHPLDEPGTWPSPGAIVEEARGVDSVVLVLADDSPLRSSAALDRWRRGVSQALSRERIPLCVVEWSRDPNLLGALLRASDGYTDEMNALSRQVYRDLTTAKRVRVRTALGTDLDLRMCGRPVYVEDNFSPLCDPECQFPGGEVFVAPEEYRTEGCLVVPLRAFGCRRPGCARLHLERGRLASVEVPEAPKLATKLAQALGMGEALCELAVGLNGGVHPEEEVHWVEKALGTIHLGFGDNTHFGGVNPSSVHYDVTIDQPLLDLDGCTWEPWIESR